MNARIPAVVAAALGLLAATADAAKVKADYRLQNSRDSTVGTPPALVDLGSANTFVTATVDGVSRKVLQFPANDGLKLAPTTGVVRNRSYTLAILAELDTLTGRRRLVDFKSGSADTGLYLIDGRLAFVDATGGSAPVPMAAGSFHQIVLTRDAATQKLTGYVDNLQAFSVTDTNNLGVIGGADTLRFFRDNGSGGTTGEASAGQLARLRLYGAALNAESVAQLDWLPTSPRHEATRDFAFTPQASTPTLGGSVEWDFYGPTAHTATDSTGMGLFDSGAHGAGTRFSQTYTAAGTYGFHCAFHGSMTGAVKVPMSIAPATGTSTTSFTLTWATQAAPSGFVYDVQIKRPSDSSFVDFLTSQTIGSHGFTPDEGAGTYEFQARMRRLAGGASGFSPAKVLTVAP